MSNGKYDSLISEAIKRILLDIVIRGHGDRLIGRWSKEPEIQQFLEQVPYMLDRINQLHLACTRTETRQDSGPAHHYHHHHHHADSFALNRSSLDDFVNLIGQDRHWLVRTRDSLGLTPLHKAVLFNNRPVVEYILDRYPDELAATSWRNQQLRSARVAQPLARLVDAQDKYGRTALHYAAALLNPDCDEQRKHRPVIVQIYHFLVAKGASLNITDFRGKTAPYYVRHPRQLKFKSVIHLANKLNANYQANVLSRTLRLSSRQALVLEENSEISTQDQLDLLTAEHCVQPQSIRESMSVSCNDLKGHECANEHPPLGRAKSELTDAPASIGGECIVEQVTIERELEAPENIESGRNEMSQRLTNDESSPSLGSNTGIDTDSDRKRLIADRCQRQIIDQRTRATIRRSLNDGVVDKINELLAEGYGDYIVSESSVSCWNQQCKRYISSVISNLLEKLDTLHELIAANHLEDIKSMLNKDPILVRIRRPYKRAAMSALHIAVQLDRRSLVKYIIGHFPESVSWPDSQGATCLHWAARCLRRDKIYRWLLEHYATQLEQIRDSRGKSAADYRQQAIRMSTFVSGQASGSRSGLKSAREIMEQSQEASNMLQFRGTKMNLNRRSRNSSYSSKPASNANSDGSSNNTKLIEPAELEINLGNETNNLDASEISSISIDMYGTSGMKSLEGVPSGVCSTKEFMEGKEVAPPEALSATSDGRQSPKMSSLDLGEDKTQIMEDIDRPNQNLLDEMVQLECERSDDRGMRSSKNRSDCDSPLATPSLPVSRPQSASTGRRLDSIIVEAIRLSDFDKLEHIVLAGCGQRLQKVLLSDGQLHDKDISADVGQFIKHKVPQLMDTIAQIHNTLHQCFSYSYDSGHDLNRIFHRLCNLMSHNRLILSRDKHGASPLHIALIRSDKRVADYLIGRHPEATSAPDMDCRTALHYAAITLAVREAHGNFKLTTIRDESAGPIGFWSVDETCKTLYDNLSCRYTDLTTLKDALGLASTDYLLKASKSDHLSFDHTGGPLSSEVIADCCPDYAKLLGRYGYNILIENKKTEPTQSEASVPKSEFRRSEAQKRLIKRAESYEVPAEHNGARKGVVKKQGRRRTTDDLLGPARSIALPAEVNCEENATAKQIAPKPTVGSSMDFPVVTASSPNSFIFNGGPSTSKRAAKKQQHNHGSKTRTLLDGLDPNHRGHSHHHHHHQQHSYRRKSACNSIVGGVIVPTIIHNDKMDEIETYDIIYRQPPAVSRVSSSSSDDYDPSQNRRDSKNKPDETNIQGCQSRASDSESSSDLDDDDDDERVERLSDEFENRVRLEKSELRAKVDQIMNEIKLSAKSSKSAHFLASSSDSRGEPTAVALETRAHPRSVASKPTNVKGGQVSLLSLAYSARSPELSLASQSLSCSPGGSSGSFSSCSSASSTSSRSSSASTVDNKTRTHGLHADSGRRASIGANQEDIAIPSGVDRELEMRANKLSLVDLPGQQVVSKNSYGQTYLHFIGSRLQSSYILYKVLDHGSHLIGERDIFYRTARDVAVQFNLPNNVQIFDKYIIDSFVGANTGLLRHLLGQGYSPLIHVADQDGNDIMLILKLLRLDRMIHFLLQMADFQRWRDELHTFIRHGYSAGVSELIRKHKDLVRAKSGQSRTSLHLAVLFDRVDMVQELLEMDPESVHIADNMGRTALHYLYGASLKNSDDIRSKLIACGANSDLRDVKMRTPKYYYIFRRDIEDIKRMELEFD